MIEDNQTKIMKFRGTLNRMAWWPLAIALGVFGNLMEGLMEMPDVTTGTALVAVLFTVITIYFHVAINKARLNEAGWSGYWMLVPILNVVVMGFFPPVESKYSK